MDKLILCREIRRTFMLGKTEVNALRGISLDIADGEFAVLAGPSGSGKTTLLNLFGLIDAPDSGDLDFAGRSVAKLSAAVLTAIRRDRIGFIFQNFNLIPVLSAFENVEFPLLLLKMKTAERRSRVQEALTKVGLWERRRHKPAELSGGEQQRVAIARALVKKPALVIADEPTANLDSRTTHEIMNLMRALNETDGATFLIASHDPLVIDSSRRVIRLQDGRIASDDRNRLTEERT
jgi:putative ABC transport system ATP-binding protein